jgi:hypothetical protein
MKTDTKWLRRKSAAAYLDLETPAFDKLRQRGLIKEYRVEGVRMPRFLASDLDKMMKERQ